METEQELEFTWRGLSLQGTLSVPVGDGPHPAVIMLQGSGPADRTSGGYFEPIRRTFLDRGLATFAYDKPGCGRSSGDWRHHSLGDRADQAAAAIDLVRRQQTIAGPRVGVWGQSQGGWLVQILASRQPRPAFAIANSGPSIGVAEQGLHEAEHTMRAEGHPEPAIEQATSFLRDLYRAAGENRPHGEVSRQLLDPVRHEPWFRGLLSSDGPDDWRFLGLIVGEDYQPTDALETIRCPFLAIYGGLDLLVPAWRGAEESGLALGRARNEDATVVVFPGGNHRIQDPSTGRFVAGYLDLLGDWAGRRARAQQRSA